VTAPAIAPAQASAQSLGTGATGTALLQVELALTGTGTWHDAREAITRAAAEPVDASPSGCLLHGAPALAFVLHAAQADGQPRYRDAAEALSRHVDRIAHQRLEAARTRITSGQPGTFSEHDLFYGLTGIGAVLLRTAPASDVLGDILGYLTRIVTRPLALDGVQVPGWWAARDPDPLHPTPGGHANFGMAHGAAGILAFASLAAVSGHAVDGQHEAIAMLCDWYDRWAQDTADGRWWPEWLTLSDLRAGRPGQRGPGRPSWCYGTPGIARALQLAAIATADPARQAAAEHALAASLAPERLATLAGPGLCHGLAGAYQAAARAAADAVTPAVASRLPGTAAALTATASTSTGSPGLLTGDTGTRLAAETARRSAAPISGWDTCLLLA
jgi:lantibiotic biosynthesis protein